MPPTGRKHGAGNYSDAELTHMFAVLAEVRPIGPDKWQEACDKHSEKFPGRDVDSIRQKYASYYRKTIPTGDPKCSWQVRETKRIKYLIGLKAKIGDGEDVYDIETGEFNSQSEEELLEEEEGITEGITQQPEQQPAPTTQQQFSAGPPLAQPSQLTVDEPPDIVTLPDTAPRTPRTAPARRTPTPTEHSSSISNASSRRSVSRTTRSPTNGAPVEAATALLGALKNCMELQMQHLVHQTKVQERAMEEAKAAREEAQCDRILLMQAFENSMNNNNNNNNKRPARQTLKNTAKRAPPPLAARKAPPRKAPPPHDSDSSTDVSISD